MSKPYKSHPAYRAARRQVWRYRRQQLALFGSALMTCVMVTLAWLVSSAYWKAAVWWAIATIIFIATYCMNPAGDVVTKHDLERARRTIDRLRWENLQKAGDGDE